MSSSPIYKIASELDPAAWGLDPSTYQVTISVNRVDFEGISKDEGKAIKGALALGAKPAKEAPARTKRAAAAPASKAARTAKASSKPAKKRSTRAAE